MKKENLFPIAKQSVISGYKIDLLKHEIYMVLIAGYDNEGNELGMGEMGDCELAADQIIEDWCKEANIEIEY